MTALRIPSLLGRPNWLAAILLLAWLPALSYLDHLPTPALFNWGETTSYHDHISAAGEDATGSADPGPANHGHSEHGHGGGGLGYGAVPLINDSTVATTELPAAMLAVLIEAGQISGPGAPRPPTPPPR